MEDAKDFHVQENLMTTHSSSPNGTVSQNQKKLRNKNMENSNERFLDRKSLLADKKELTDNDIDTILELSSEEINISSLENFTHKKFNDLSISEKADLISKLENADYKKYKNSFLSTSKLLYEKSETLSKEIKILKTLDELNYSIYLLPYGYARNNQDFMQKTTDSILKHKFLEMKSVSSSGKNAGYNAFRESKKQAENAILSFEQDISPETALNNIQRSLGAMIKGYKERGLNYDMSGSVFLHFEKTGVTKLYEINKDGKTKELNVKAFGLKNTRELDKNSQVEAEVTAKPIEQPMNTITQNKHLSNQQSQEENNMPEQNNSINREVEIYKAKLSHFSKDSDSRYLQKVLEYSLDMTAIELPEIEYTRENYNRFFNRGEISSPIGKLKMGNHQFEKFNKDDRKNLIKAAYETLTNPSLIISKETYDEKSESFKPLNVFGKSFYRIESGHKRVVESVVVFKNDKNIVIGSHNNDVDNFVRQIKTADQIIYADENISRVIAQLDKEVGNQVLLYSQKTEAIKNIPQNKNLSNQQSQEKNNMPEQNTIHTFTDDEKKMSDFNALTKREFLDSHSDVKESDYDATVAELKEKGEYTAPWNTIKKILGTSGRAFANEMQYQRELHQNDDYTKDADGNFMRKFDAAYFTIEKHISHHGLDMNTYRDLFGDISEETATEIEDEKRDILGPEVVEELVKGALDFEDFLDIQQAYDRALVKSNTYLKYAQAELTEAIGKQDNLFVNNLADYLNSATRYYEEIREPTIAEKCEDILSEALFTAETEVNTVAFRTLLDNGADITYRKTEVSDGKEYKANILHYIAADDNTEALSLIMDDAPSGKHFNRLTAGEKLSLLREQNFEGRTPLEVSENHYKEEPSRYEPDMIMPDVMRELAYQEEDLMSHVPPLVLTDKITGNILMIEQANGDGCEINLFDKNKKLVDHDISAGYTNNLGESVDYKSSLEAARVSMAEYEKQSLWGNFYEYEKLPATVSQIQALRDSRDEFFKTLDAFDKNLNPKLSEIDNESSFSPASVRFTSFIPKEVLDKLGIDTEENEDFYRLEISLAKDGKLNDWYLDSGSAMTGVGENIEVDFSEEEKKKFNFIFEKVYDAIRKKYPSIEKLVDLKERDSRTVTQSVTFPAHFIDAEKQSITLLEKMQDKYGFGENDFEKFVNDGDVDIHFAAPVPKEYQFPKSKTDEWIKAVCKDLEENFGSTDVSAGMDGSERTEKVFDTAEDAEKFVAEKPELTTYHILKESDVNREMAFSEEGNTVATVGVAPTIQTLRTRVSSTALRTSATTVDESIIPQTEKSSEMQFKDFVKEVELEYKDLRLFRKATVNVLKRLPPEQKSAVKAELLKRGANNPESLALVMKNEVKKQHSQKKNHEQNRNRNIYELER